MSPITGIPTTRVSDIFVRQRLLNQVHSAQAELYRVQMQLSTGKQFQTPSEDPVAALQVIDLQRLLERKAQVQTNLSTNQSYLSATDSALSSLSEMLSDVRGLALSVLGTTASDEQRAAVAQQVEQVISQLLDTGNQKFRGRYLFSGSKTTLQPFQRSASGYVEYLGNEQALRSYADIDLLFSTNITGNQVFGALSDVVKGTADLNPVVTYNTRLSDLRGGAGISPGSIAISDGTNTSIIDLSSAETVGDLCSLIQAHPPEGRTLDVAVVPTGITIQVSGGDLSIKEVGGGTTASELGIRRQTGVGTSLVTSRDLDPILRQTTSLDDIFGARASAVLRSSFTDSDIIFEADHRGTDLNGVTIELVNTAPAKGAETVTWDPTLKKLTIGIKAGQSRASNVIAAVTAAHDAGDIAFTARIDPLDNVADGQGLVQVTSATTGGGSGSRFDQTSGLIIQNGGQTFTISLSDANTIEDLLNILNGAGAGLLAEINEDGTGINLRSRISGADFTIGENGGSTATAFGLRTFTESTRLEDLNFGRGVTRAEGTDFVITRKDGVQLQIDLDADDQTIADVLEAINNNLNNTDGKLTARLAAYGNGIELVDTSRGSTALTVTRAVASTAAIDLGLIPAGQESNNSSVANGYPSTILGAEAVPNCQLVFRAKTPGTDYNDVTVEYVDTGVPSPGETVNYDPITRVLTINIDADATDANRIKEVFDASSAADVFTCELYGTSNDGTGLPGVTDETTAGGTETLTASDVNPQETVGVFNALLRLHDALLRNDDSQMQRAINQLDDVTTRNLNFSRAELGARQQGLDLMQTRLDDEDTQLRQVLSQQYDADMVDVATEVSAQQVALEASLRATAQTFQLSLLNYL